MNRMNIFQVLRSGRVSALIALVGLVLLFSASGAKAGCAVPYTKGAAPAIPLVSPQGDGSSNRQEGAEWDNKRASIVGLWHVIYTATSSDLPSPPFPSKTPFQFVESYKTWHGDGT